MTRVNEEIRMEMRVNEIPLWRLAEAVGVSEPTITRWFRHELEGEKKARVELALRKLTEDRR